MVSAKCQSHKKTRFCVFTPRNMTDELYVSIFLMKGEKGTAIPFVSHPSVISKGRNVGSVINNKQNKML